MAQPTQPKSPAKAAAKETPIALDSPNALTLSGVGLGMGARVLEWGYPPRLPAPAGGRV